MPSREWRSSSGAGGGPGRLRGSCKYSAQRAAVQVALQDVGEPGGRRGSEEIFLSAHRKLEGSAGSGRSGRGSYGSATNHCLDYLLSRAARTSQLTETLDDDRVAGRARARRISGTAITKMDLGTCARAAARRVPRRVRLHDMRGPGAPRKFAEALGIAEGGTSKSQVRKASVTIAEPVEREGLTQGRRILGRRSWS